MKFIFVYSELRGALIEGVGVFYLGFKLLNENIIGLIGNT